MPNYLYVDNSNVWIEGMHVAAVAHGLAPNIFAAQEHKICDYGWKIDFGKLLLFAGGKSPDIGRAVLYGSKPPPNDSLWAAAKKQGFEVIIHERSLKGTEKKVDTNIATDIVYDALKVMDPRKDEITLVAGDSDYVPTVEKLIADKYEFYVVFWDHAAKELRNACTKFTSLNAHLEYLRL